MTAGWRRALLLAAFGILGIAVWHIAAALPAFGEPTSAYGPAINAIGPAARHVANMVTAVNFDFRSFDTLGEESILACAVTGAVVLLRGSRGERTGDRPGRVPGRPQEERADATTLACRIFGTLIWLFGLVVALNGSVTPGGGFQGGAMVASSTMLLYLGEDYATWRKLAPSAVMAALEGSGVALFVAAAGLPLLLGLPALTNILPLGRFKEFLSGGTIFVANCAVALAVIGGFVLLLLEFLEETRTSEGDTQPSDPGP